MKSDFLYKRHMLDAIARIERYVADITFEKFAEKEIFQSATVRELEIIGEASKHLSDEYKNSIDGIPWRDIGDMRNKLIHEYFSVDVEAIWETIKNDLPPLKAVLQK